MDVNQKDYGAWYGLGQGQCFPDVQFYSFPAQKHTGEQWI